MGVGVGSFTYKFELSSIMTRPKRTIINCQDVGTFLQIIYHITGVAKILKGCKQKFEVRNVIFFYHVYNEMLIQAITW